MKFELKTENDNYSKLISPIFNTIFFIAILIIFTDVALKLKIISRNHQIEYRCKLLAVEKSKSNFKKLAMISNLKSKKIIWEFCREFIK